MYYSGQSILPHYDTIMNDAFKSFILGLNDSMLILSTSEWGNSPIITNYQRIKMLPEESYVFPGQQKLVDPDSIPNPLLNHNFFLVNSLDPSKKVRIKETSEITLHYSHVTDDSLIKISEAVEGFSYGLNDTAFVIQLYQIRKEFDSINSGSTFGNSVYTYNNNPYRTLKFSTIERISYSNSTRSFCNGLGSSMLFLSLVDALVVAPLVSIGYSHNGFKMKRYSAVAGIGLLGVGISIPLILFGQDKNYQIAPKGKFADEHYWYLERE
jgi:hypothetical protein